MNGKLGREVMSGVFKGMIDELGNKEFVVKKIGGRLFGMNLRSLFAA